jgi:UDPglucose 6-dehydrogenase
VARRGVITRGEGDVATATPQRAQRGEGPPACPSGGKRDLPPVRGGGTDGGERRIGLQEQAAQAGLGFGGSCFPKDVTAFSRQASDYGVATPMLDATLAVNDAVRERAVGRLAEHLDLVGARVAVWGLAFKADTDDVRESPALRVIDDLLAAGAAVTVHDPVALVNLPDRLRQWVRCAASPLDAAEGADAVILATGWAAYGTVPARSLAAAMRGRLVLDGRGTLDAAELSRHGLTVLRVGRPTVSSSGARRAVSAA